MDGTGVRTRVLERVSADFQHGMPKRAANLMAGYVSTFPTDLAAREALARIHASMRNWAEAGRWGYFAEHPDPRAISAFEKAYREPAERWDALRWPQSDPDKMPPVVRQRLVAMNTPRVEPSVTYAAAQGRARAVRLADPASPAAPAAGSVTVPVAVPAAVGVPAPTPVVATPPFLSPEHELWVHRAISALAVLAASGLCGQGLITVMRWLS